MSKASPDYPGILTAARAIAQRERKEKEHNMTTEKKNLQDTSDKARWFRAVKAIRGAGVVFKTNVQKCCSSCVTPEQLGLMHDDSPYGFNFGGQGGAIKWSSGGAAQEIAYRGNLVPAKVAYINWAGKPEIIVEAFKAEGFRVEFDGSEYSAIEVFFQN